MSDLNRILAFRDIMPYLSIDEQRNLASTLGLSLEEVERRLSGKDKEDEFLLILLLMDACKSIAEFDEGISQLIKTATSDLLIELKNGTKFMLEIKHTDKDTYSISHGNLSRRIDFAHKYGLELYFAISIKGYWLLFDEQYMLSKQGKIDVSDFRASKLDEVLGCVSYIFPKGMRIKSVYSKTASKKICIGFEPYGNLVSYELYCGANKIFRVKGKNSPYIGYIMILEALQDRLSMDTQEIMQDGEFTIINEEFRTDFNAISEYKFLLAPIEYMVRDGSERYDAHSFLEQAKENPSLQNSTIQVEHIRGMVQLLVDKGVDIKYIRSNYIYAIEPTRNMHTQ